MFKYPDDEVWYEDDTQHVVTRHGDHFYYNGRKEWFKYDKRHREDGPAVEFKGDKEWWLNGVQHRENGPAIERQDGSLWWMRHGLLHRIDGPTIIYADGSQEWHYNGEKINCSSQKEFERLIRLKAFW